MYLGAACKRVRPAPLVWLHGPLSLAGVVSCPNPRKKGWGSWQVSKSADCCTVEGRQWEKQSLDDIYTITALYALIVVPTHVARQSNILCLRSLPPSSHFHHTNLPSLSNPQRTLEGCTSTESLSQFVPSIVVLI